jgi:hypothetical protein
MPVARRNALILLIALLHLSLLLSAQKEVFFTNIPKDSIKVESLHGISIGTGIDFLSTIQNLIANDKSFSIPLSVGYFNEKRIAPTITFVSSMGLTTTFSQSHLYTKLPNGGYHYDFLDPHYTNSFSLDLGAAVELRWYWGYKRRYEAGRAKLNSGWYLSLPISIGTTLIDTYKKEYSSNYINYAGFGGSLGLGYRRAISSQWFLEGNVTLLGISTSLYSVRNTLNLFSPYISYPTGIGLSAAYTLK